MTDAVLALFDNGRLMMISFVAIESIIVIFTISAYIGLCSIGFPVHVMVIKLLDAAVSRYLVAGSFMIVGSSMNVSSFFLMLLCFSLLATNAARFLLHEGGLLCTNGSLILLLLLVLLSVSSSFPRLQFLFLSVS